MKEDKCSYCDKLDGLEWHHILPRSMGGTDDSFNLIRVCNHHHALIHGLSDRGNISDLVNKGLQRAKEKGVVLGPLLKISPEVLLTMSEEREYRTLDWLSEKYHYDRNTILRTLKKWNKDQDSYTKQYLGQTEARLKSALKSAE